MMKFLSLALFAAGVRSEAQQGSVSYCFYIDGDGAGSSETILDGTDYNVNSCPLSVVDQHPTATGASWEPLTGKCWAEFGTTGADHFTTSGIYQFCHFIAGSNGDPHLTFAHGGKADFRGTDGTTYNMLSAPDFSLGMTTRFADFMLPRQLVHGSFMTEAYFVIRSKETGTIFNIFSNASTSENEANFELQVEGTRSYYGRHRKFVHEDITVTTAEVKLTVSNKEWEVILSRRAIREPLDTTHHRFDLGLRSLKEEKDFVVFPHGILGQSFDGDKTAVDGAEDYYHGAGAEFTTTAMAEGAIEGKPDDYVLHDPFSPKFKFSRFYTHDATPPRDVSKLAGKKRSKDSSSAVGVTEVEGSTASE